MTRRVPTAGMAGSDSPITLEEWEERQTTEREAVKALLKSEAGKVLLGYLSRRYDGPLVAKVEGVGVDREQTLINVGARSVYIDLRDLSVAK